MARDFLEKILSDQYLHQAWRRVKANGGCPGYDGVSIAEFEGQLEESLQLIRRLVLNGRYHPLPFLQVSIRKPRGGQRVLAIPTVADRIIQASVTLALDEMVDPLMSDASFGYRRGRSVQHAVARVMTYRLWGSRWAVDGDIDSYFDSIPHKALLSELEPYMRCSRTLQLVASWLSAFSKAGRGIAQGSPLSPILANLYLDPVDKKIHTRRARLVRFADDFVLLTQTQALAMKAMDKMQALLEEKGGKAKPSENSHRFVRRRIRILGLRFQRRASAGPNASIADLQQQWAHSLYTSA